MSKDIWKSLLITHQGNSQLKDNKIDLLVQQYEQYTILEEESIDSDFARFNTIITSLKALDEGFSSKNYVRKFLRAQHPKWRAKVTGFEEIKDLSSLTLDELIGNLKYMKSSWKKIPKSIEAKRKDSLEERVNLLGNQEKKRSHSEKGMRRKERVIGNALDAVTEIISLAIVQNHLATKIKRPSLEVLRAIAKMTPRTKLTMKLVSWLSRQMSANSLREMLNNQKSSSCKIGLGFDSSKAPTSKTKPINFVGSSVGIAPDESTIKAHGSTIPGSVDPSSSEKAAEHFFSPPMSSRSDFVITRKKLIDNKIEESKKSSLKPSLKSGLGYVKTESRSKTPPPRRNNFSQPRHNAPQPRRNSREPIHQNFYPMNWNNNQSQGFVHMGNCMLENVFGAARID
ncbi:hypothetical protein Tco_0490071 [Tanacetum coccineum]